MAGDLHYRHACGSDSDRALVVNTQTTAVWFVKKGSRVQGPFSVNEVSRFLLLGRVRNTDTVSRDGEIWEPVTQVPELVPEELLDLNESAFTDLQVPVTEFSKIEVNFPAPKWWHFTKYEAVLWTATVFFLGGTVSLVVHELIR